MKQRVITGILFTIAILAFVVPGYFSPYFLSILWAAVAIIICREMILCVSAKKMTPGQYLCYSGACFSILPVVISLYSDSALLAFGVFSLAIILLMLNSVIVLVLFQPGEHAFGDGIAISSCVCKYNSAIYPAWLVLCGDWTFCPMGI
jgi:CDP-diglyceride synthetase